MAVSVLCFFITVPWLVCCMIVAFPGHTHLLFLSRFASKLGNIGVALV